jgi:hypothetical protein
MDQFPVAGISRPRRTWKDTLSDISGCLGYAKVAFAVHETDLAFIGLFNNSEIASRVALAIQGYRTRTDKVTFTVMKGKPFGT